MRRARITGAAVAAAVCAGLALTGCSGERDTGEGRKVEDAVKRFALARGPEACDMLTGKALTTVYGRRSLSLAASRSRCLASSSRFQAQRVEVTFVKLSGSHEAHATARTLDHRSYYTVGLGKRHGRWRIDSVTPAQKSG